MADSFTHLHVHTEYSMLDGAARLDELVAAAAADGQPALGITDHGNMYGILDFYRACKDQGVKPILGTEAYMAHDHRTERIAARGKMDDSGGEGEGGKKPWYHLTLLAESEVGYKNLIQLASRSFMEGYYRKPKVDWELLEEHSEGLIATTGCLGGHVLQALVPKAIMDPDKQQTDPLSEDERFDNAVKLAGRLQDIFGRDNLFVELQDHGIPAQQWSNPRLAQLAKAIRAPLLATNDSHYVHREDALSHDALLCQPPGTLVRRVTGRSRTPAGEPWSYSYEDVPIEAIGEGDKVLSWSGKTRRGQMHKQGSPVTKVGSRRYEGKLVRVTTERGRLSRYTQDHICIARTDVALPQGNHIVYLMRRGQSFRLGATTHKREFNNKPLGAIVRAKEQGCDDIWILSVHESRSAALMAEALLSFEYGIPTWQFRSTSNQWVDLDGFWEKVGALTDRARRCLEDHHRLLEYPFWSAGESGSSRRPKEIRACNLLNGMLVCEPDECTDQHLATYHGSNAWSRVSVAVEPYAGVVHSIDVDGDHTYVADGIVTHNCVQTNSLVSDKNRFKFHGDDHYLKSAEEMRYLFRELPTACDNTLWVAERCEVEIEFGKPQLPNFPLPPGFESDDDYLRHLVFEGAKKRWGDTLDDRVTERLLFELKVIGDMGFSSYFLITWDLIKHARDNEIRVGPGRGSAAGCAVAYTLWITDLDPIKYDLLFERFLNPSRISMPDIDMDFDTRYRDEMIRYAAERYGRENVAQIITFGTIKARQAVRDAARVLGHDYGTGDRIAKAMPPLIMGRDTPLYACLEEHPKYVDGFKMATEIREMYTTDPVSKEVIDVAKGLEGLRRSDGIHAAAVVITKEPLTTYLPIQRKPEPGKPIEEAPVVTQYEMHGVEDLGLLKMDFLGLRNLDIISDTLELIEMTRGEQVDIDTVDLEDSKTFDLLQAGQTVGVFQLESPPMRALMRSLAPDSFEDVAALVALYRPGPMAANMHNDYADRKNGRKPIEYLHPDAEEILGTTYGLCLTGDTTVVNALTGEPTRLDRIDPAAGFCVQGVDDELRPVVRPVTHWVANGERETVRLTLADGHQITGTPDHPVLTERGWVGLGDLRSDDHVAVPKAFVAPSRTASIGVDRMRVLGNLLTDGSVRAGAVALHNVDEDILDQFTSALRRAFPGTGVVRDCTNGRTRLRCVRKSGRRSDLAQWLRTLGIPTGGVAFGSADKFIPPPVFAAPNEELEVLLAGLWDCDGHVNPQLAVYTTVSKQLADDVVLLLRRLGIDASHYRSPYVRPRDGMAMTAHQIAVFDGARFSATVGRHLASQTKRQVTFTNVSQGRTLARGVVAELLTTSGASLAATCRTAGVSRLHFQPSRIAAVPRVRESVVASVSEVVSLPPLEEMQRVHWIRVESVEPNGVEPVFDITVDEVHNFVANGVVVHNCIYQESVMRLAQKFAGYTLADADLLRKAAGKKSREIMQKERAKFVDGCERTGYGRELGDAWFDIIEPFADYAFNRSHSVGYGFIAYQIAYLKANYPAEYMSALLTSVKSNLDKAAIYLAECRAMDIPVTVADINRALIDFAPELRRGDDGGIDGAEIVFGMSAVRGVGTGLCHLIIAERDANGPFTDFYDFCERVDLGVLNKKTVEALIKAGAFDSVGHPRQGLLMVFESIIDRTIARRKEAEAGVMSLFDTAADDVGPGAGFGFDEREEIPDLEFPKVQKLAFEKEMLGLYVSDHPLFGAEDFLARRTELGLEALAECEDGAIKTVGGVITNLQRKWTKKGDLMGVFVLEDLRSNVETMVFPRTMTEHGHKLEDDAIVIVKARVDKRDDMPKLIAMDIEVVEGVSDSATPFRLRVMPNRLTAELIAQLKEILLEHPGDHPVLLHLGDDKVLRLPPAYGVDAGTGLVSEIRVLLGPTALIE